MKTRLNARGGRLRLAVVAACLATTGTAYAAATPAAQDPNPRGVTMAGAGGASQKVRYGTRVTLAGRVGAGGQGVQLEHAPRGRGWRPLAHTASSARGGYRFTVRARQSGAYRAVSNGGAASPPRRVAVRARLGGRATRHVRRGGKVRVAGALRPSHAGRAVSLQVRSGGRWKTVDRTRTRATGRFRAAWRPQTHGSHRLRVRFGGDRLNTAASAPLRRVRVYRPGVASWYGPGLYGNPLGCGGTLGTGTLGVAHRTLPCGTKVGLRYRGRSLTVRVVDRGPFHGGREWDLTGATKQRLGFGSTGTVWTTR